MKKSLLATLAALSLAACSKEDTLPTSSIPADGPAVYLTFTDEPASRAFFATTATAETWEKTLSSLAVYVFNPNGDLITRRTFTSEELSAKSATISLPHSAAGTTCDFYAVANLSLSDVTTKTALLAKVETAAADYNGTFADVSTKAKRAGGFVMSAATSKAVSAAETTAVTLSLKRTVAKIAVQTSVDPTFAAKYSGTITITSVKLSRAASQTPIVAPATPSSGAMTYTHTQAAATASGKYNNLFYVFENGSLADASRVTLEITATYDADGNSATTADRSEIAYTVPITGKAGGAIARNGYYRIAANITGLVGTNISMTVSVADWESPISQNVNLGA